MNQTLLAASSINQDDERSIEVNQAIDIALNDIKTLGCKCEIHTYGHAITIYEARILDHHKNVLALGTGKGEYPFNKAGAIFEAIEHFFGMSNLPAPQSLQTINTQVLADQSVAHEYLPLKLLTDFPHQDLFCSTYHEYNQPNNKLILPAFLWAPEILSRSEYICDSQNVQLFSYLMKYSSNSGIASGLTTQDALLHSINEAIERDGLGAFLYQYCYKQTSSKLPVIDKESLPEPLKSNIQEIEQHVNDQCILINATTNLRVPVIAAIFKNYHKQQLIPAPGFGASLYPEIAIKRAVHEALQIMFAAENYHDQRVASWKRDWQRAQQSDAYARCTQFNLQPYLDNDRLDFQSFERLHHKSVTLDAHAHVNQQISRLISRLKKYNLTVYMQNLKKLKNGTNVVSVQIPGVSLFYLTSNGMMIPPHSRTITCMNPN
ncbi:YcaO-like family protein [Poriferisphaera corsica]|uniref:YcaO-like family protein n=1 Tax=Poriferisphaera corsica TaxID=2528020 RepID=A0A517YS88_9BACT|nr:YcaO-like family protein [Poriferisphaera corsica]QDU33082.1 YcaO-like family protein [Poriferisphaera corsica]